MRLMAFFVASFVLCSVVFSLSVVLRDPPSDAALREPSSLNPLFQITQGTFFHFFAEGVTTFTFLSHPIAKVVTFHFFFLL